VSAASIVGGMMFPSVHKLAVAAVVIDVALPFPGIFCAEAEAYCRQRSGTLTPGIGPRWDPWPYICSMSRPSFFFLSLILLIGKGGVFTYYTLLHLRLLSPPSQDFSIIYVYKFNKVLTKYNLTFSSNIHS
jgi:hypothetical protein